MRHNQWNNSLVIQNFKTTDPEKQKWIINSQKTLGPNPRDHDEYLHLDLIY